MQIRMQQQMTIAVPYISEQEIELSDRRLLQEVRLGDCRHFTGIVPVESSLEHHLKCSLDFNDLHKRLGVAMTGGDPEVLGAVWVGTREVFIDQSLDPDENPGMEGRFRFTVAHEIGHWWLHRGYIQDAPGEIDLFG